MLYVLIAVIAVAVATSVVTVSTGRLRADPLAEATRSTPDHGLPDVPVAADVDAVRFDTAPRGYHPGDVDAHLDELRDALADRERELALLRAEAFDHTMDGDHAADDDRAADDGFAPDTGHAAEHDGAASDDRPAEHHGAPDDGLAPLGGQSADDDRSPDGSASGRDATGRA
ncbi:MAG: DivIVA domain-containing protein [Dermatophilaceae bacterium]